MKKLIYCAAAALALMAASCGQSDKSSEFFSASATDSLTNSFGQLVGTAINQQILQAMTQDSTISKEAFINGLQYALAADTAEAYMNGMNVGLQIQRQISSYAEQGVQIDKRALLNEFKKAFLIDSMPNSMELEMLSNEYRRWNDSLSTAKRNYEIAQLEQKPEAVENLAKGEAYIKDVMAKDPAVKVLPSGMAYKVENPGEEPKVSGPRVVLNYQAKRLDGTVVEARNSMPVLLSRCTPGLAEGVKLLGKGGKATLYVPGKLAYGVEAPQGINVGLNEALVYEVEVVDIPETPTSPTLR